MFSNSVIMLPGMARWRSRIFTAVTTLGPGRFNWDTRGCCSFICCLEGPSCHANHCPQNKLLDASTSIGASSESSRASFRKRNRNPPPHMRFSKIISLNAAKDLESILLAEAHVAVMFSCGGALPNLDPCSEGMFARHSKSPSLKPCTLRRIGIYGSFGFSQSDRQL